jgi:hypothetical protein
VSSRRDITDDPDKGLIYTCNCGWIDASQADGEDSRKLW